ncbi:MAG: hypothetical protein F7B17_04895 [Desulfurococcales archaeon]|nr:hypothetical protein [Desulfurococcales archaeon]
MGREVKLERVRYLDGMARFYEWVSAALVVGTLTGRLLVRPTDTALGAALIAAVMAVAAALVAYRLRRLIEAMWVGLMREDPRLPAIAPLALIALAAIALIGVALVRLLLGP